MPQSELRLIKGSAEFIPKERVSTLPKGLRGLYVLYSQSRGHQATKPDVVYFAMRAAERRGRLRGRLTSHRRTEGDLWTPLSVFEVIVAPAWPTSTRSSPELLATGVRIIRR